MISSSTNGPAGAGTDRRAFLRIGGITLFGLAAAGCADSTSSSPSVSAGATNDVSAATTAPEATSTAAADSTVGQSATTATTATTAETAAGGTAVASSALTAAAFDGLGTCSLMPDKTAGPFPLDEQFDRRDVTEGVAGHPMRLGLRVVDEQCAAVPGAKVEIWHADASGDYSAFKDNGGGKDEGTGTTFLRGTQTADANGIVEFLTVYPGWYSGRAVHIHLRVHLDEATVLTSQMFFDPDYTAGVFSAAPYAEFGPPDTSNEADGIAGDPEAEGTLLHTSPADTTAGAGTLALLNLGIR